MMPAKELVSIVQAFRTALEAQKKRGGLPTHMRGFPRGCCGVVSELLGDYLNAHLRLSVEYVCGEQGGTSHAWLEHDGIVIDITGDQFEGRPPVFLGAKDNWYFSWGEASRHIATHEPSAWTYREERAVLREVLHAAGLPCPHV